MTSRTADRHATALAELLGVDVHVLASGDDAAPRCSRWLDDDSGSTMLAPQA